MKKVLLFWVLVLCLGLLPAMALADMEVKVWNSKGELLNDWDYVQWGEEVKVEMNDPELTCVWSYRNRLTGSHPVYQDEKAPTFTPEWQEGRSGWTLCLQLSVIDQNTHSYQPVVTYEFPLYQQGAQQYEISLNCNEEGGKFGADRLLVYEDTVFRLQPQPNLLYKVDDFTYDANGEKLKGIISEGVYYILMPSTNVEFTTVFRRVVRELRDDRGNVIPLDGTGMILNDRTYTLVMENEEDPEPYYWIFNSSDWVVPLGVWETEMANKPMHFTQELREQFVNLLIEKRSSEPEPMTLVLYVVPDEGEVLYLTVQVPKVEDVPQYPVTVNGAAHKKYLENETVHLSAGEAPSGKVFDGWEGLDDLTLTSGSADSQSISFTMPARPVNLITVWKMAPGSDAGNGSPAPTPSAPKPPRTGDASAPALWLALAALSLAGAWVLLRKKPHIG